MTISVTEMVWDIILNKGFWKFILFIIALLAFMFMAKIFVARYEKKLKGWKGESIVKAELSELPEEYKRFDNVYVPGEEGGVNEIDHVIVSRHGIFAVETKNYSGYLYGTEHERYWKQVFNKHSKFEIDNPLQQNQVHIRYLMEHLNMPKNKFHSVICFVGSAEIKKPMPDYVLMRGGCNSHILNHKEVVLSEREEADATDKLARLKSDPSLKSAHRRYLRERNRNAA